MFKKLEVFEIHDLHAIRGGCERSTSVLIDGCKTADTHCDDNCNGIMDAGEVVTYDNSCEL